MTKLYAPMEAARMTGISVSSIRSYTKRFDKYMSRHAAGRPRKFTMDDVKLCAFIAQYSGAESYQQIEARIDAGQLADFDFQPNLAEPQQEQRQVDDPGAGTIVVSRDFLRVVELQLADARQREEQVRRDLEQVRGHSSKREEELLRELADAREEIGRLKGRLEQWQKQQEKKSFWKWLFGG